METQNNENLEEKIKANPSKHLPSPYDFLYDGACSAGITLGFFGTFIGAGALYSFLESHGYSPNIVALAPGLTIGGGASLTILGSDMLRDYVLRKGIDKVRKEKENDRTKK